MPSKCYVIPALGVETTFERRKYSKLQPVSDYTFVGRVKRYLRVHKDEGLIEADTLVSYLRNKYPEYGQRTFDSIKGLAGRVVAKLTDDFDFDVHHGAEIAEGFSSYGVYTQNGSANNSMLSLYSNATMSDPSYGKNETSYGASYNETPDQNGRAANIETPHVETPSVTLAGDSSSFGTDQRKSTKQDDVSKLIPNVNFSNVAGYNHVLEEVLHLVVHLTHPEIYTHMGVEPPRGFLLHGPPGCGKTHLAYAIAGELKVPLIVVGAPELVAGISGQSEKRIREVFEKALGMAPCILFIDEIDAITSNRKDSFRDMEKRMVSQMLLSLDELNRREKGSGVLVIGATNKVDRLDPALRRAGRFDREIRLGMPDRNSRLSMLKLFCGKLTVSKKVNFEHLAGMTPGFVAADLRALVRETTICAVRRILNVLSSSDSETIVIEDDDDDTDEDGTACGQDGDGTSTATNVQQQNEPFQSNMLSFVNRGSPVDATKMNKMCAQKTDFMAALKIIQPSSTREGFATVPNVTWNDVGSLANVKEALETTIMIPIIHEKLLKSSGLSLATGILLCGPPGCGKTLLAKAVANQASLNFISVKGPELLDKYVGGSERAVRECFQRARNSQPCVIFFDELDAICSKRGSQENDSTSRVVNQLLTEMDGISERSGVFLMAATNRPDMIDAAVLRPGRFDRVYYVGFPNKDDRVDILRAMTKNGTKPQLGDDVNLEKIAGDKRCSYFTGADLSALVWAAGILALRETITTASQKPAGRLVLCARHFNMALADIKPSVKPKERRRYNRLERYYSSKNNALLGRSDGSSGSPTPQPPPPITNRPLKHDDDDDDDAPEVKRFKLSGNAEEQVPKLEILDESEDDVVLCFDLRDNDEDFNLSNLANDVAPAPSLLVNPVPHTNDTRSKVPPSIPSPSTPQLPVSASSTPQSSTSSSSQPNTTSEAPAEGSSAAPVTAGSSPVGSSQDASISQSSDAQPDNNDPAAPPSPESLSPTSENAENLPPPAPSAPPAPLLDNESARDSSNSPPVTQSDPPVADPELSSTDSLPPPPSFFSEPSTVNTEETTENTGKIPSP